MMLPCAPKNPDWAPAWEKREIRGYQLRTSDPGKKKKKKRAVTATVGATAGKKADNPIICRLNPERRASSAKKKQKPAAEVDESGRLFQVWSRGEEKEKFVSRFASLVGTKNVKKKRGKRNSQQWRGGTEATGSSERAAGRLNLPSFR